MNGGDPKPRIGVARKLARKLLKDAEIHKAPIVLNEVVRHIRKNQKIKVLAWEFGKKTSGIQISTNGQVIIGYNSKQHVNRQRFSVAHELGHYLLGHTHKASNYNSRNKGSFELEAYEFASELLMPLAEIKKDYIGQTNPKTLASKYQVSEQVMWIRLMKCGLIK